MELAGSEKRIQALFSELRVDDARHLTRFETLTRRESMTPRIQTRFAPVLAWAVVLVFMLAGLAWWSIARRPQDVPQVAKNGSAAAHDDQTRIVDTDQRPILKPKQRPSDHSRLLAIRSAARRRAEVIAANKKALEAVKAITA